MKFAMNSAGVLASALICLVAQNAYASTPTQDREKPIDSAVLATRTPQQPLPMHKQPVDEALARAAAAARRDLDPRVNGSINDVRQGPAASR